ncbi:hypothetical protein [Streptomyces sp. AC602_WCS936]|uniref:hypothetical protein n=1 Tax=Streptomyces sp. AC602_WCS936 TaxID=2823685 RepID=UPI001C26119E|nr:hypothetical protein [Streptomyces sp. AC602_WCS936]
MSHTSHVRLLPWKGPEGKRAYLVTDGTASPLSLLADEVENQQVESAAVVVELARPMVQAASGLTVDELRWITRRLVESLTDVLNIAESRARRVPPYDE